MSDPLIVIIPHRLGKEEAIRRLRGGLSHPALNSAAIAVTEEKWVGDRLTFKIVGMGLSVPGSAIIFDDNVRLEVLLPWLIQSFAKLIQSSIASRAQILLEKPNPSQEN